MEKYHLRNRLHRHRNRHDNLRKTVEDDILLHIRRNLRNRQAVDDHIRHYNLKIVIN